MTAAGVRLAVGALVLASFGAGCHKAAQSDVAAGQSSVERIVHGIVVTTGTSFAQQFVLDTGHGMIRLLPTVPADSIGLAHLGGVELSVRGSDEGGSLRVKSFTAQRVSGKPVVDGYVRLEGDAIYLETANGRLALGNPPPALRQMAGARVWIDGPLDRGPNAFGVILPR